MIALIEGMDWAANGMLDFIYSFRKTSLSSNLSEPHFSYSPFPKDIPRVLIHALIIACLLMGLASLRNGLGVQGWLNVIENWLLMLIIFPTATAVVALPFKYRDPSFELKLAYYLGMFVALLFTIAKLRYWR